jgi:hypothetical protein
MHTCTLDFGTVLKGRLRPPDQPIAEQGIHTRAIVRPGREGPTILVQLRGGLQSSNRTVTPMGTTTIRMAGGAMCIDNASDTTSTTLSRIFRLIKVVNLRGIKKLSGSH